MISEDQDQASEHKNLFATTFSSPPLTFSAGTTYQDSYIIPEGLHWKFNDLQLERQRLKKLENERLQLKNRQRELDKALTSKQCSAVLGPPEASLFSEEQSKDAQLRTPTITTEEAKKADRRERDRKRKQEKKLQDLADLRAYEEMCVNARKIQQPDTVITLPKSHQDRYIIPEELQWKVNEFQLERQRLKKIEDERLQLEKRQREKDLRNEKQHLDQLRRKANKEEQEQKRIKAYQELDIESHNLKTLRQYTPIQQYVDNANVIEESPIVTSYSKEQSKIKTVHKLVVQMEEQYPKKSVKKAQQTTQRKDLRLRQLAEKHKQEQDRTEPYHNLDVKSPFFNSATIIEFKQFTTPEKPNPKNRLIINKHNKGEHEKFEENQNHFHHRSSTTSNIELKKRGTQHNLRQKKLSFIEEEEVVVVQKEVKETTSATLAKGQHLESPTVIEVSEDEEEEQQNNYPIMDLSYAITIEDIFSGPSNNETLLINNYAVITRRDLLTLKGTSWLNDEVINFYMHMLQHRDIKLSEQNNTMLRSWFASSFFFVKLLNDGNDWYEYNAVRKWTRKIDIFSADKVLIPINLTNTHWTILVFYMLLKEIHYYDSRSGNGDKYIDYGLRWLADEIMDKKGIAIDINEWTQYQQEVHVPQQNNGYDCGMFVLMCARAIAYNQPFSSYHQRDVQRYRSMIGRHILQGSLLDFTDQSVPYMFQLTPEQEPAQSHNTATESLFYGTSLRRKRNTSTHRQLSYTHVQPQRSQFFTKSTEAAIEEEDSEDSEETDGNVTQRQLSYTHVQPQRRSQFSTKTAEAAIEVEDSEDSEENDGNIEPTIEETKCNPYKSHVHVNMSIYSTKSVASVGEEVDLVDSGEDDDNKPTEGTKFGRAIFAQEYGTKTLSITKTKYSETEENLAYSNSDTEGTSETCESETKFGVDAVASSTRNRRGKSNEALTRKNKALRNNYWIKNEQKRKSNKNYKTALLDLNDSDLTSMPTGTDHQVR